MNEDEISYALAKQLTSATTIESNYGSIDLDAELRRAVDAAVRPILERRMAAFERGSTNPENLIEGIQRQCARVREDVLPEYDAIPTGAFAARLMRQSIRAAEAAIASGDVVAMVSAYGDLEGYQV